MNLVFNEGINVITGHNGVGKTSILEAVYSLLFGKSYFSSVDKLNLKHNEPFFRSEGNLRNTDGDSHKIVLKLEAGKSKVLELDGKKIGRLSNYIGKFLTVCVAPEDIVLVNGPSVDRRNFLNQCIAQFDKKYTRELGLYNKALKQRNSLLKQFTKNEFYDPNLLAALDYKLIEYAPYIHEQRAKFLKEFENYFQHAYDAIAPEKEKVTLVYDSKLHDLSMKQLIEEYRIKDRASQRTNVGPHKDELIMELNATSIKSFGSQGQIKSYVIALKIAEFTFLLEKTNKIPVFILDDMFDKLDRTRAEKIMFYLHDKWNAQIFISDTDKERVSKFFEAKETTFNHIHILPNQEVEYLHV